PSSVSVTVVGPPPSADASASALFRRAATRSAWVNSSARVIGAAGEPRRSRRIALKLPTGSRPPGAAFGGPFHWSTAGGSGSLPELGSEEQAERITAAPSKVAAARASGCSPSRNPTHLPAPVRPLPPGRSGR